MKYEDVINNLIQLSDDKYKNFTSKLTNSNKIILGVNIPTLREISKKINLDEYLEHYQGIYFEETLIYGLSIEYLKNKEEIKKHLLLYSKEIDDWSLCDNPALNLKVIKTNNKYFLSTIETLLSSKEEFVVRFGIVLLFSYINDEYIDYVLSKAININSDKYYINMAIAWILCECFIKYKEKTIKYIDNKYLNEFVLNKTISKINDSFRVSKEDKELIKKRRV